MGKKKKQKFYAIKRGNGVENKIVTTWDECSKLVLGYDAVYKSFFTEEEAKAFLENHIETKIENNDATREIAVTIKSPKKSKKVMNGENTIFHIEIPTKLFKDFRRKCEGMGQSYDFVVKNMIEEWVE